MQAGFMKAGRVGFLPIEWRWADDDDRPCGIDFTCQELLGRFCRAACNCGPVRRDAGVAERRARIERLRASARADDTLDARLARPARLDEANDEAIDPQVIVADAAHRLRAG